MFGDPGFISSTERDSSLPVPSIDLSLAEALAQWGVCVCVFACAFLIHWHTTHSFSLMPKGSLAWTLLDSLALSLSLTLVLPHIIVCFTIFFYSSHRTGHSVKSHMLYRIQTVLFVTFSFESVSVIFFLILIYIFLILHEASTVKKGQEYLKFYILMPALIIPLSSFIFMLKSIHYFYWQYWDSVGKYSSMYLHVLWRGADHNSGLCLVKA